TIEGTTPEQKDSKYKVESEVTPKQQEEAQKSLFKSHDIFVTKISKNRQTRV
ncbi:20340_t:CDS:1, partial [Gigaspora rosea]